MTSSCVYIPLTQLKYGHPYQITNLYERNGGVWLILKDHEDPREIRSLVFQSYHTYIKALWQLNRVWDREEATMIFKNYGYRSSDNGGAPVFTVSGSRLMAFIM